MLLLIYILWLAAAQIDLADIRLLTRRYNFKPRREQRISWIVAASLVLLSLIYIVFIDTRTVERIIWGSIGFLCIYALAEWALAKIEPTKIGFSVVYRLAVLTLLSCQSHQTSGFIPLIQVILCGLYFRNCPFGIVHGKNFRLTWKLDIPYGNTDAVHSDTGQNWTNVREHGVYSESEEDVTERVQAIIDRIGENGGGTVFFPRGTYLFNTLKGDKKFLQINYSNITLEGETDQDGNPLTKFVCCNDLVDGSRNPWLSPFLITTGERLQPSNNFWGLDFRNRREMVIESSSLSDPGSDGRILTPDFATSVTGDAAKGERIIHVADSSNIGQYIMLGMYNTTDDGNLIRDILGTDRLRDEWLVANRAGKESAPSFQLLTRVERIVDSTTIELAFPLPRDISIEYEPAIFNVSMLENVAIRNLRLTSRWNGLFRHHGVPLYYSVGEIQAMDYGWNAINMKRVANGSIDNVIIDNYTNPVYVTDSLNCDVRHLAIRGYDGHQGLKVYCHACYNHFSDIRFLAHFADMLGGEGNAYCNTFEDIEYDSSSFKPVDFDFHGFSEGPMSPPSYNTFRNIRNFRYIKGAGAITHLPSCARDNRWVDIVTEGERKGCPIFYAMNYRKRNFLEKYVTALGYAVIMAIKKHRHSFGFLKEMFRNKVTDIERLSLPRKEHYRLFADCHLENIVTACSLPERNK